MSGNSTRTRVAWKVILNSLFDKYANQPEPEIDKKVPVSRFTLDDWSFEQFHVHENLWFCKITSAKNDGVLWWWQHGSFATDLLAMYGADPAELAKTEPGADWDLEEPISSIVILRVADPEHWLYLTLGLSGLAGSGDGYDGELSFRLACNNVETMPPLWPLEVLNAFAQQIPDWGALPANGAFADMRVLIEFEDHETVRNFGCAYDENFAPLETSTGTIDIKQLYGMTDDELEFAMRTKVAIPIAVALGSKDPDRITRPGRQSVLETDEPRVVQSLMTLAKEERNQGHVDLARQCLEANFDMFEKAGSWPFLFAIQTISEIIRETEGREQGEEFFRKKIQQANSKQPAMYEHLISLYITNGGFLIKVKEADKAVRKENLEKAEQHLKQAHELLLKHNPQDSESLYEVFYFLAVIYMDLNRNEDAEHMLYKTLEFPIVDEIDAGDRAQNVIDLIGVLNSLGKTEQAAELRKEYASLLRPKPVS